MANLKPIPFATATNTGRNKKNSNELLLNCMAVSHLGSPKNQVTIESTPGHSLLVDVNEKILGIHSVKDRMFLITASKLYECEDGNVTLRGTFTFDTSTVRVSIANNGLYMVIVADIGYHYELSTDTLVQYTAGDNYLGAETVTTIDGYFVFNKPDTFTFYISEPYSIVLDALDFASKEANPDNIQGVIASNRQLWLIGDKTTEVWGNAGASSFPFVRVSGAVHEIGCSNHHTIAKISNSIFFLGDDGSVYQSNGYSLNPISTETIEYLFNRESIRLADAFTYEENGHDFYVLSINNQQTFVYDTKTTLWHNRATNGLGRWGIKDIKECSALLTNVGIDSRSGKVYKVNTDITTEDEEIITRTLYSVPLHNGVDYVTMSELQIDMVTGAVDEEAKEEGQIPVLKLQFSDDGGGTWSNIKEASIGNLNEYNHRVIFRRLGRFRERTIKITFQEKASFAMLGAYARFA